MTLFTVPLRWEDTNWFLPCCLHWLGCEGARVNAGTGGT